MPTRENHTKNTSIEKLHRQKKLETVSMLNFGQLLTSLEGRS